MEHNYLLDTNICIDFIRGNKKVRDKIINAGENHCYISIITLYELTFGAYYAGEEYREKELAKIELIKDIMQIIDLPDDASYYARKQAELQSNGIAIDSFDMLIATTAMANNLILVTDNMKHFKRIKGLELENWIR